MSGLQGFTLLVVAWATFVVVWLSVLAYADERAFRARLRRRALRRGGS